jgi:hypothetical protein
MYEVYYLEAGISHVRLFDNLDDAVDFGVDLVLGNGAVLDYLIGPNGEIRNDVIHEVAVLERKKRKDKKSRDEGKPFLVEVKAIHLQDFWSLYGQYPNQQSADNNASQLVSQIGEDRVRVRELRPTE